MRAHRVRASQRSSPTAREVGAANARGPTSCGCRRPTPCARRPRRVVHAVDEVPATSRARSVDADAGRPLPGGPARVVAGRFVDEAAAARTARPTHACRDGHPRLLARPDVLRAVRRDDLDARRPPRSARSTRRGTSTRPGAPTRARRACARAGAARGPRPPTTRRDAADARARDAHHQRRAEDADPAPALERPAAAQQRHARGRERDVRGRPRSDRCAMVRHHGRTISSPHGG